MRSILRKFFGWIDSKFWLKAYVVPLAISLPPVLLAQTKWDPGWEKFFNDHPYTRLTLVFWPALVVLVSAIYQGCKPPKVITSTDFSTLLEVLRRIVGAKVDRFAGALQRFGKEPEARAKSIFTAITKPEEQLEAIVAGIYQFFEATRPATIPMAELKIRVAVAKMGDQHIESFGFFYPPGEAPRSELAELRYDECGFSRAKASGEIVIVEDFVAESTAGPDRKFVITHNARRSEDGSMICYPITIRGTSQIPYVISICAAKKKYFKKAESEYYSKILAHFEQRIVLEYCLKTLKSLAR